MRDVIICTVGTSMLGSLNRHDSSIILERNPLKTAKYMRKELEPSQQASGAEINSITSIIADNVIQNKHGLYFLVSDTEDGEFVGQVLKQYYKDIFDEVTVITLKGLHDQNFKDFRNRGLCNLVKETSQIIKRETDRGHKPIINATGGFKAQISFAGLIGQVLDVPVYYMFERFSNVIEMPPMPVAFDFSLWLKNFSILHELSKRVIIPKDDEVLSGLDPKLSILLTYDGDDVMLSAMGELFYEGFYYRFSRGEGSKLPPTSGLDPKNKECRLPHRGEDFKGISDHFRRICEVDYVTRIDGFYYNPDLSSINKFRKSSERNDCVEGWFSDGTKTAKFSVYLMSDDPLMVQSAVVDLTRRFCK